MNKTDSKRNERDKTILSARNYISQNTLLAQAQIIDHLDQQDSQFAFMPVNDEGSTSNL